MFDGLAVLLHSLEFLVFILVLRATRPSYPTGPGAQETSGFGNTWLDWTESNKGNPMKSYVLKCVRLNREIETNALIGFPFFKCVLRATCSLCPKFSRQTRTSSTGYEKVVNFCVIFLLLISSTLTITLPWLLFFVSITKGLAHKYVRRLISREYINNLFVKWYFKTEVK